MKIKISPRAFFFDFDGVIVDSEKYHMMAALEVSAKHGIKFDHDYYVKNMLGFDDYGIFNHLWETQKKPLANEDVDKMVEQKNQNFLKLIDQDLYIFPGIKEFILSLHNKKIPMCIVSGALESEIEFILKKANLRKYFEFIIAADMVTFPKPDPESYEYAWEEMLMIVPDLQKTDCWVIEDSPAGLSAALDAEMNVVAITNSVKKESLNRANHIVSNVSEIEIA